MQYEFDGYSEASSNSSPGRAAAANTRNQGTGTGQNRNHGERRTEDADGFYHGTGRFARENRGYEARDRRQQQQQQQQQQQRPRYTSPYQAAFFEYVGSAGPRRSEEEWSRIFMEAFRRTAEERRGGGGGGGGGATTNGAGAGLGYAAYGGGTYEDEEYARDGFEDGRGMGYEEFLGGLFAGAGSWYQGTGFEGGRGGLGDGRRRTRGSFGHGPGSGVRFEELFGSPGHHHLHYGDGEYGDAGPRRGGAGMTREEFDDLFRARFEGPSPTGYGGGGPPADLFERWRSDW
ncbi:hypothetical protein CkaCkLH20_03117 [Colletotrichum karsti]|uniref:Uncharacterized protein n=1 Tax=Colletotrichum karsti TaxID=1095194 RepID=A0A9P6IB45_9PEZI|nr:uncharacterized protein CkaCkLH20_03117 [Colletotrichum karsti]KAF9879574.1 hypothetical protein CkaCkLH20_03117 [Colletotrichum karsti]